MTLRLSKYWCDHDDDIARGWFFDHRNTAQIARRLGLQESYVDRVVARLVEARYQRLQG